MPRRRRSYEAGHKPKLLVVIDDTEECDRAVYFAEPARGTHRRQRRHAARDRNAGPQPAMARRRRHHEARRRTRRPTPRSTNTPTRANGIAGITPERVVREGDNAEEILKLIEEDEDISILVLAAGTGTEGPGPLVADNRPHRRRLSDSGRHRARASQRRRDRRAVVKPLTSGGNRSRPKRREIRPARLKFQAEISPRIRSQACLRLRRP